MENYFEFEIAIGDWFGNGHGESELFLISSNENIENVREAFFNAREIVPREFHPDKFCNKTADNTVDYEFAEDILKFYSLNKNEIQMNGDGVYRVYSETMLRILLAFLSKGNLKLKLQHIRNRSNSINRPQFHFVDFDYKKRQIPNIGYGLYVG